MIDLNTESIEAVRQSFGRCCMTPDFFDRFYQRFLAQDSNIASKFTQTDMTKQKSLLRESITFMLLFADGKQLAQTKMTQLRESHSREHHNIEPHMYRFWIDALLQTLSESDTEWSKELEDKWRQVIKPGIEYMKSGY